MPAFRWILVVRIALYACFAIGALGAAMAVDFAISYMTDVPGPLRDENTLGVAIALAYTGAFWLAAPLIARAARHQLSRLERLAAYAPLIAGAAALLLHELTYCVR